MPALEFTGSAPTSSSCACQPVWPAGVLTLGCTPSSTKGFASLRNSPERMTTVVVPSPTWASQEKRALVSVMHRWNGL